MNWALMGRENSRKPQEWTSMQFQILLYLELSTYIFWVLTYIFLNFFEVPVFHCCNIKIHLTFVC